MKNLIYILVLMSMTSCFYERIELDLNAENPKLVVEAWITDFDERQYVVLSRTVNYLGEQEIDYVDNATVTLQDANNTYNLVMENSGYYYLPEDWEARLGDLYTLTIDYNGTIYEAQEVMTPCPEIENVTYQEEDFDDFFEEEERDEILYRVDFSFQDPPGQGDGYYFIDYPLFELDWDGSPIYADPKDKITNGFFEDDQYFDGDYLEDISVTVEDRAFVVGDTAIVELFSIGSDAVHFLTDMESELYNDSPFAPPPANVRSNISNGAVGYFMIGGAKRTFIVIEELEENNE